MSDDRDMQLMPVDVGRAVDELLDVTVRRMHEFTAPAGTDLAAFAARLRAAWVADPWPTCRCGATAIRRSTELCRDCTAAVATAGAR